MSRTVRRPDVAGAGKSLGDHHEMAVRVHKRYAPRRSVGFELDVDLTFRPGVTAVLGASGAGKTTLLHCVAGLVTPDEGLITLCARTLFDAARGIDVPAPKRDIGLVFQDLALFPHLDVRHNVAYGLGSFPRAERYRRCDEMLATFRIAHLARRRVGTLSGGERQRVACARSLAVRPRALLLDEAFASLDRSTKQAIMADLVVWNREHRVPIVLVTHAQSEARALADHVVVLASGRVVAQGAADTMLVSPSAHRSDRSSTLTAVVVSVQPDLGQAVCAIGGQEVVVTTSDPLLAPGHPIELAATSIDPAEDTHV